MGDEVKPFFITGELRAEKFGISGTPVAQQTTIADPAGGATVDAECRAAVVDIIARLKAFGLIA